ncbi:hypothetical protein FM120_29335 [Sphingobacterium faecium PCAi_F2.5]|nr:hypothetical protein FM120_29335 [Sphingobacterium faecium PCAi_F2.5]
MFLIYYEAIMSKIHPCLITLAHDGFVILKIYLSFAIL